MSSRYPTFRGHRKDLLTILEDIKGRWTQLPQWEHEELENWYKAATSAIEEALHIIGRPIAGSEDLETFAGTEYTEIEAYLNYISTHSGNRLLYNSPRELVSSPPPLVAVSR